MRPGHLTAVRFSDSLNAWPKGQRAVMLVPGEHAIVLDMEVPARVRRGTADRIAFHAVQDLVGEAMEDVHFVLLPRERGAAANKRQAIVTNRACMEAWRGRAREAGIRLAGILPDHLALPWSPGSWTVSVEPRRLRARLGRLDGFAAEPELGIAILERRLNDAPSPPERIVLMGEEGASEDTLVEVRAWLGKANVTVEREALPAAPSFEHGEIDANLVAGAFSENLGLTQEINRWRMPAALATAALLAWALDSGLALRQDRAEIEALDRRIEEIFRAELMPTGPIVDIRIQSARSIDALRAQSTPSRDAGGFLALLASGGEALTIGTRQVSRLSYREGVLTAEVTLADFRALDSLGAELARRKLIVDMQSSNASGEEGVQATLAIRPRTGERS